ncbi:MAG: TolC family protein [Chitinophagaceae bacterium]|nr:TolC family protein [Chitinophagaceae bacterium]
MRRLLIIFSLLPALQISAQKKLSLEEAIATALDFNYDIQLSKTDSAVAALDYSYRNAVFLPRLNSSASYLHNNNKQNQEFTTGTKREGKVKTNNISASVNLNWTLFDGMKMFAARDKAEQLVKLGGLGIKEQIINTIAAVINTYYNIVRQKQQLKAVEEQMALSAERAKLAQYKLDIGVGTKPDVLQSKVDHNAQKALQLEQLTAISQLKQQLNQAMNLPAGIKESPDAITYDVDDLIPVNAALSLGDIQNNFESANPALLITKKNIDIAGLTLKERKAERFPTLSFNSAYNFSRTNNNVALNPALPIFNQNKGLNYGLTASIPILNGFNTRRLIKQAELNIRIQRLFYESQKSQLNLAIVNAFLEYEQQKKALALEEENIVLARENVNIVFQVYKLNSNTLIQLKEAEKSLQDAYTRLITARYNTKVAETELLRLKGDLVK